MAEYRIEFQITRRQDDEDDFNEIGFGSSGAWDDLDACTHAIDSLVSHAEWETESGQPDPNDVVRQIMEARVVTDDLDIPALRAKAEAATPGPWDYETEPETGESRVGQRYATSFSYEAVVPGRISEKNAAYIAAFNPEVGKALLDEVERLRAIIQRVETFTNGRHPLPRTFDGGEVALHFLNGIKTALNDA